MKKGLFLFFMVIIAFAGCTKPGVNMLNQSEYQIINDLSWESLDKCKNGSIVFFAPKTWGNAQYPLTAVYAIADFNYPIIWNEGGVVCVFTDVRLKKMKSEETNKGK
ncbi:MAG: hypothetical protein HPY53_11070 [Brevinematales bacterium]|nr:hypothetical protein [Brevinematales bacterium]